MDELYYVVLLNSDIHEKTSFADFDEFVEFVEFGDFDDDWFFRSLLSCLC